MYDSVRVEKLADVAAILVILNLVTVLLCRNKADIVRCVTGAQGQDGGCVLACSDILGLADEETQYPVAHGESLFPVVNL